MLVDYAKNNSCREFEFVKKVDLTSKGGKKYSRMFWKLNGTDSIATYTELNNSFPDNAKVLAKIRDLVDDRIVGFSFGKKPKSRNEPEYQITLDNGQIIKLTYSQLKEKLESLSSTSDVVEAKKLMLEAPFVLGKNMITQLEDDVFQPENKTSDRQRIF